MKSIEKKVGIVLYEKLKQPIRTKQQIVLILLEAMKLINDSGESCSGEKGKIVIYIDKMSRIFFEMENKIFSFCFPFSLEQMRDGKYKIYDSLLDLEITNQMISMLYSIFQEEGKLGESLESVMDFVLESAEDFEYKDVDNLWGIIFRLWHTEYGYVRYDYDPLHEDGAKHPLHHLDINYSGSVTYKVGLNTSMNILKLKNILDITTECAYLS